MKSRNECFDPPSHAKKKHKSNIPVRQTQKRLHLHLKKIVSYIFLRDVTAIFDYFF